MISNEVDKELTQVAWRNARTEDVQLRFSAVDWRQIVAAFGESAFSTTLMMGNSIGLINDYVEICDVLSQIFQVLRPGGQFVVDQRNYDYILEDRRTILGGKFRYSKRFIYCGEAVTGRPIAIGDDLVVFGYFGSANEKLGELSMLPLREERFYSMLLEAGFAEVRTYYDFSELRHAEYDFVTFVATKL